MAPSGERGTSKYRGEAGSLRSGPSPATRGCRFARPRHIARLSKRETKTPLQPGLRRLRTPGSGSGDCWFAQSVGGKTREPRFWPKADLCESPETTHCCQSGTATPVSSALQTRYVIRNTATRDRRIFRSRRPSSRLWFLRPSRALRRWRPCHPRAERL